MASEIRLESLVCLLHFVLFCQGWEQLCCVEEEFKVCSTAALEGAAGPYVNTAWRGLFLNQVKKVLVQHNSS